MSWRVTLLIAGVALIARAPALLHSVAAYDEGLYLLVAREWLHGHLPYTTVWETKPPGLFALLALGFAVLGVSVTSARILSDVAVVATALGLCMLGRSFPRGGSAIGVLAALLYVTLTTSDSGTAALGEIFYAPFVVWPLVVLCRRAPGKRPPPTDDLAIGISLGIATQIKESVLPEVLFVIAASLVLARGSWRSLVLVGAGIALPILSGLALYVRAGALALYWDANVGSLLRRAFAPGPKWPDYWNIVRSQMLAFFPASFLLFALPAALGGERLARSERRLLGTLALWALVDVAAVIPVRAYIGDQFLPAMAPLAVIGAWIAVRVALRRGTNTRGAVALVGAVSLLAHSGVQLIEAGQVAFERVVRHDPAFGDDTAELAEIVRRNAPSSLYVALDVPVLYVLADRTPPTRYAYPPHLTDPFQEVVAGVDGPREIARILSRQPAIVVYQTGVGRLDPRARATIERELATDYDLVAALGRRGVYRRRGGS